MTGPVPTVFLGSGRFGAESLARLAGHPDVELVGAVTAPARPAGRGGRLTATPIEEAARSLGLTTVLSPLRLRSPEAVDSVLALRPRLAILADYGQLVPPALLELALGALNLHPSLLPRHRGASPIPATILAGDRETGVTLMRMDAGLDTGPTVAVQRVALTGRETAPELEDRLQVVAADLLERSIGPWIRGELVAVPQPGEGATLTRPLRREDGRLDPARPAADLERQIRAYQPWPGSWIELNAGRITVWRASVAGDGGEPGTIERDGLATTAGRLILEEVQPAGGKRMTWDAYLRGRPDVVGSRGVAG
jgi:methionyl-tRNA formyltransferase